MNKLSFGWQISFGWHIVTDLLGYTLFYYDNKEIESESGEEDIDLGM